MTLTARLTLSLLLVFVVVGSVLVHQSVTTSERYFQDVTQRLSAPIAMYVAEQRSPFRDGTFDPGQFRELARVAMILNPAIEIYALDPGGRVLADGAGLQPLALNRVDLEPIRRFIDGRHDTPLLGDDPRNATSRRIFSAALAGPPQKPWGYIYVILDSGARQQLSLRQWPAHLPAIAGWGVAMLLLAAFVVASLFLAVLTRPLRSLAREVALFEAELMPNRDIAHRTERNEISRLRVGFAQLRLRVSDQMRALHDIDASRREWIAHLSHDLRTPLATLETHLETVLRRDGAATAMERRESLARALLHCAHTRRLLSELSESARLEAPTLELRMECFALGELVQDVVMGMRETIEASGIHIDCRVDVADSLVRADIGLLQRLVENLLNNAAKASSRGGVIHVGVRRSRRHVVLSVTDAGTGPTGDMIRVFNQRRQPQIGGAGLGLRIVAQILRLHDMRSWVEEPASGGSMIRIEMAAEDGAIEAPKLTAPRPGRG